MNKIFRGGKWIKLGCFLASFFTLGSLHAQTNLDHSSITNPPPAPRRPSIVLIIADNIGYGDLSCYGQTKFQTPNLDKFASEGIRFTSYYVGSPEDEASRASLFTGLEPRHINSSFSHPLPMDAFTAAALLKETGYHTGLMGEWNLGDTASVEPNTKGFMEFAGQLSRAHASDYFSDNIYRQDTMLGSNRLETLPDNWNNARGRYIPDLIGSAAANFIRVNAPTKYNHHQAFFLCVSYPIPHNGTPPQNSRFSGESWPQTAKNRADMIAHMDDSIGRVLNQLATFKMDDNTVVIFTSIGGAQQDGAMLPKFFNSSGPLRGEAGSVYEGGIRVPMIIRWPAKIQAGQVSDFAWAAWDLMPTLAEIAFTKDTEKTDGISILPLLTGKEKAQKKHDNFYWQTQSDNQPQQSARMGDWKIVRLGTNAPELYNLKTDLSETNNVAVKNPDVLKKVKGLLDKQ